MTDSARRTDSRMTDSVRATDDVFLVSYRAVADARRAELVAATESPFTIEVRFLGGLSVRQQAAFTAAADRWATVIVGDLPAVTADGETIDDVLILAQGTDIDGAGGILGQAGPTVLRPSAAGAAALLPAEGVMYFDTADLAEMEREGTLNDVITHEMGHVLGIGTIWRTRGCCAGSGTDDPTFSGAGAVREYAALLDGGPGEGVAPGPSPTSVGVPVENRGGAGTREGHWREAVFGTELMSGFIRAPDNPISRMTVASLGDMGYQVDLEAAEPYELPAAVAIPPEPPPLPGMRVVLPVIPRVLPESSLIDSA